MKISTFTALLLAGFIAPAAVNATNYYVSSTRSGRSDSNAGTSSSAPWATIAKVRSKWSSLQAGDTVYLERGSVFTLDATQDGGSSFLKIQNGGTASSPITLTGLGYGSGAKPIIRRTGDDGARTFIGIRCSNVTIRDIELDGNMADGYSTSGVSLWTDSIWDGDNGRIQNVKILNMYIHNLGGSVSGSDRYICGIMMNSANDFPISDCLIEGNTVSDYSAHGLNDYSGEYSNNIWRNNRVINDYPYRDYTVNSAMQVGSGIDNIFEYNYLHDTTLDTHGAAIRISGKGNDSGMNTIRYNVIVESGNNGITFVQSNESGPWRMLYDIYGNIIYNCNKSGILVQPGGDWENSIINIYNNTLYNNWVSGGSSSDGEITLGTGFSDTTLSLKNNLIYHTDNGSAVCLRINETFSGFEHANNLYYQPGSSSATVINNRGTTYSLNSVSSFESSAQNSDPQFINTANLPTSTSSDVGADPDGLSVLSTSPALNNGVTLGSSYALDINRTVRTVPWSIGAYEESTAEPPSNTVPEDPAGVGLFSFEALP